MGIVSAALSKAGAPATGIVNIALLDYHCAALDYCSSLLNKPPVGTPGRVPLTGGTVAHHQ